MEQSLVVLPPPALQDKVAMFREKARKIADTLTDSLAPSLMGEKAMTMQEISSLFDEKKAELMGSLVTEFIGIHHQEIVDQQLSPCPKCGKLRKAKRQASRRVESCNGSSLLTRPYFFCPECGIGFSPLDETLQLSERRKQYDLQRLALDFIAEMPFERAAELFSKSTGISFSSDTLHDLLVDFTDELTLEEVLPTHEEIDRRIALVRGTGKRRPVLVVATDGAHVPTRPQPGRCGKRGKGEYHEAKGFRLYLLGKNRIVQLVSWHQIQDANECAAALKTVAALIPIDQVRVALIGDGASWVWRAMTEAFPTGREVLDYYHCSEHIHTLANSQYPDDPQKRLQWVEATMARLYYGEVSHVVGGLRRMKPRDEKAAEEIRKLITYLQNNAHRIDYRHDRAGGYAIGSGGIESANKFICHVRLKRSGAWWLQENANGILALRCAIVNGTLDDAFSRFVERDSKRHTIRTNV
jgi:ssDNA-binding Zn-finger/Zn-ribbon topoisomerase 1